MVWVHMSCICAVPCEERPRLGTTVQQGIFSLAASAARTSREFAETVGSGGSKVHMTVMCYTQCSGCTCKPTKRGHRKPMVCPPFFSPDGAWRSALATGVPLQGPSAPVRGGGLSCWACVPCPSGLLLQPLNFAQEFAVPVNEGRQTWLV
jgi:hypothetical protein